MSSWCKGSSRLPQYGGWQNGKVRWSQSLVFPSVLWLCWFSDSKDILTLILTGSLPEQVQNQKLVECRSDADTSSLGDWRSGSVIHSANEVTLHWARLILLATVQRFFALRVFLSSRCILTVFLHWPCFTAIQHI